MEKVGLTETVLRDGNQSLLATRMPYSAFKDILGEMDKVGFYSVECWGGATFDSCLRFLNENPFDRLRAIRRAMPNTKLQMLLRGKNLVGYKPYPDDVIREFIAKSVGEGIDVIRIFDAMNDFNNIRLALEETLKRGAHASCAIAYTVSPVHTTDYFVKTAKLFADNGANSICIKDMSGILTPSACKTLVSALKKELRIPIVLHSHCSCGNAYATYYEGIKAGADVIDGCISSFADGPSLPSTETLAKFIEDLGKQHGCETSLFQPISKHFFIYLDECFKKGEVSLDYLRTNPIMDKIQLPGGMYTNLLRQLKEQNNERLFPEILAEIPSVRKDLGYPPLVTPISQIVGTQSLINVTTEKRYEKTIDTLLDYVAGKYGAPIGEMSPELLKKVAETRKKSKDKVEKENEKSISKEIPHYLTEEEKLSVKIFPELCEKIAELSEKKAKEEKKTAERRGGSTQSESALTQNTVWDGKTLPDAETLPDIIPQKTTEKASFVSSSLPGTITAVYVKKGESVKKGEKIFTVESMKMENTIFATTDFTVKEIRAQVGKYIEKDQPVIIIQDNR